MTTQPTYSIEQQIHSLSSLSNPAFGVTSYDTIAALQAYVASVITNTLADATVQGLIGDWQVVWGPVVWTHNPAAVPAVADNTMVLFYNASENQFVVAIAGTNIDSTYGWLKEDFGVSTTVAWQSVVGSSVTIPNKYAGAAISTGTSAGLAALLSMQDGSGTSMLTALQTFVAGVPAGANVAVAGHSLGGALSPVLALYMQNLQSWNAGGKVTTIGAWPTAGPTPGEKHFAAYYAYVVGQKPPSGKAGLTYTSKYNSLDVVPHAWQASTLAEIPFLYEVENGINPPANAQPKECIMGSLTAGAALNALNTKSILGIPENTYTQVSPWTEMTGTFDTTIDDAVTKKLRYAGLVLPSALRPYSTYFMNLVRFVAQLAFQHTTAYTGSSRVVGLLDIQQFTIAYQGVKASQHVTQQTEEQLHEAALSRAVGVNLGSIDAYAMARANEQAST